MVVRLTLKDRSTLRVILKYFSKAEISFQWHGENLYSCPSSNKNYGCVVVEKNLHLLHVENVTTSSHNGIIYSTRANSDQFSTLVLKFISLSKRKSKINRYKFKDFSRIS